MDSGFVGLSLKRIDKLNNYSFRGVTMVLVIRGSILLKVNQDNPITLVKNDVVLINDKSIYSISGDSSNMVLMLTVSFENIKKEFEKFLDYSYSCNSATDISRTHLEYFEIKKMLIRMMMAYYRREEGFEVELKYILLQLLHNLFLHFRKDRSNDIMVNETEIKKSIKNVLNYMNENFRNPITLDMLAKREFLSTQYLSKFFKREVGTGFLEYLNTIRLNNAVTDLLYTDHSLTQIAFENGFSSAKAFTTLFKKIYKCTPKTYKKNNLVDKNQTDVFYEYLPLQENDGLKYFFEYINLYDIHSNVSSVKKLKIDIFAKEALKEELKIPAVIFKIGYLSELLLQETQEQLMIAKSRVNGKYVYCQGVFKDGMPRYQYGFIFEDYEYKSVLNFLQKNQLLPFFSLDLSCASESTDAKEFLEEAVSKLKLFLNVFKKYYSKNFLKDWRFELFNSEPIHTDLFLTCYLEIYKTLKSFSDHIKVGFFALSTVNTVKQEIFIEKLLFSKKNECIPDFITFTAKAEYETSYALLEESDYRLYEDYNITIVNYISQILDKNGLADVDMFLTEWNTLVGNSLIEQGSFFRSALIIKDMLAFEGKVTEVAFWLNSHTKKQGNPSIDMRVLGLFICETIERAPFHVLDLLMHLHSTIVKKDKDLIVTKTNENQYEIIVYNPNYLNPIYALNEMHDELLEKQFEIELHDLVPGRYFIKTFHIDMSHYHVVLTWSKAASPNLFDQDVLSNLKKSSNRDFDVYEENIVGSHTIHHTLKSNAISLIILKKI